MWPCANKTLLTKISGGLDSALGQEFADPDLDEHLLHNVTEKLRMHQITGGKWSTWAGGGGKKQGCFASGLGFLTGVCARRCTERLTGWGRGLTHAGCGSGVRRVPRPAVAAEGAKVIDALAMGAQVSEHAALIHV